MGEAALAAEQKWLESWQESVPNLCPIVREVWTTGAHHRNNTIFNDRSTTLVSVLNSHFIAKTSFTMSRPTPRGYPQDYIVRIRYQNTLPPPQCPPKLLDIPNSAAAQFTDTSFASKLARTESISVDVDSELGMPLDMVHVPRVFDGDDAGGCSLRLLEP